MNMDLSLPLLGVLGAIGYNLNRTPNSRDYKDKRNILPPSERGNGESVYESRQYVKIKNEEQQKLDDFYKEPNSIYSGPMFKNSVSFSGGVNRPADFNVEPVKEDFSELSGLKADYTHQNMQPFFGGKMKASANSSAILSKYTGNERASKVEKMADIPTNKQEINGMPAYTLLVDKSRFDTSRYISNTLPTAQYKVPPIIPEDNDRVKALDVDQLRALNNQKISGLAANVNPGSGNYVRAENPNFVEPRKNTTFVGAETMPTFSSSITASYQNADAALKYTTKAETMESQLNIGYGGRNIGNVKRVSSNENDKSASFATDLNRTGLANDWVRNKSGITYRDNNAQDGYFAAEQERETSNLEYLGNSFQNTGNRIKSLDKPKTTNKELSSYSYTPTAQSMVKAARGVEFYTKQNVIQKATVKDYTAGGLKKFAPQRVETTISSKNNPTVGMYNGIPKFNNPVEKGFIGERTSGEKKFKQVETDFSYRLSRS